MTKKVGGDFKWTQMIKKNRGKTFVGAIQNYYLADGTVLPVCFSGSQVYLFEDEQGLFSSDEMKMQISQANKDGEAGFPYMYDEYKELLSLSSSDIPEDIKTEYPGLTSEMIQDILARRDCLADVTMEVESKTF